MNARRPFLYGFALGIMLATLSSYYHFCRPLQPTTQADLLNQAETLAPPTTR